MKKNLEKEVRDEKIARIVKEFREKFERDDGLIDKYYDDDSMPDASAKWLTQTLTTLLNEE